jgi:hypothetical protein
LKKGGKKKIYYSLMHPAFSFYEKGPIVKKLYNNYGEDMRENDSKLNSRSSSFINVKNRFNDKAPSTIGRSVSGVNIRRTNSIGMTGKLDLSSSLV